MYLRWLIGAQCVKQTIHIMELRITRNRLLHITDYIIELNNFLMEKSFTFARFYVIIFMVDKEKSL